jgi:outer membrane protein TolC
MVLLFMGINPAIAQTERWTLVQCLERALEFSPEVHEALADIQIAESQLAQAKAGRLPQLTVTGLSGIVNGTKGEGFEARTDNSNLGPFFKGELEVVQPLYTFGRLRAEIRAARQGVTTKHAASEQARQAVIAAVKELYYNLLFSRQIQDLLTEVKKNFAKALETAEERLEAQEGDVTQQDILKLRIGLAGVTKEVFSLERAIAVTRAALKRQLHLPPAAPFDIADTRLDPVELRLQPLATYLEQVSQYRPELVQLETGLEARKARLQAARSAYYPSLFLAGGVKGAIAPNRDDQKSPFAKDDFNFFNGGMALGLRWQLDFWMTRAKVAERMAEVAKVKAQKQNAETGIALDIRRRYLEVQENQQKLEAAQIARKAARALMVTSLANFTLGIGEAKDVFSNLGLYIRMASDYYKVIRDLNIAAARLSQATGQEVTTLTYRR